MGNRQKRRGKVQGESALAQAGDRALIAYESVARSMDVTVTSVLVIGADSNGQANISLSCEDGVDMDEIVKAAIKAYFEGRGCEVSVLVHPPRG